MSLSPSLVSLLWTSSSEAQLSSSLFTIFLAHSNSNTYFTRSLILPTVDLAQLAPAFDKCSRAGACGAAVGLYPRTPNAFAKPQFNLKIPAWRRKIAVLIGTEPNLHKRDPTSKLVLYSKASIIIPAIPVSQADLEAMQQHIRELEDTPFGSLLPSSLRTPSDSTPNAREYTCLFSTERLQALTEHSALGDRSTILVSLTAEVTPFTIPADSPGGTSSDTQALA
ncbi:hypothetical protein K438DRAFT_1985713 [Mycena galopus ATCC 62051]|nr:hypothetical protein K438DRAFT_1985713 [Mycena galopus ATCC 62051]